MPGQRRVADRDTLSVDVAIVGAGIVGLWVANLLAQRGLSVVVCEANAVGGTQTMASQGIVHGGGKYALDGDGGPLSRALADMPRRWRACLAGNGEVDLRGVAVLSDRVHVHTEVPDANRHERELDDFVIDVPSLVRNLAKAIRGRFVFEAVPSRSLASGQSGVDRIELDGYTIRAGFYILAAGGGNEALAGQVGFAPVPMQLRPLRQTIVRLRDNAGVFAHWRPGGAVTDPAITVTSHASTLIVGGTVANEGVQRSNAEQIQVVRTLLARAYPAIDLAGARFETFVAVRAEPAAGSIREIGDPLVRRHGNCLLCWPVKLSLVPRLGDLVGDALGHIDPLANSWPGNTGHRVEYAPSPYSEPPC